MIILQRDNVVRRVASDEAARKLEEQGFTRDDSVVTISTSYLANANIDHDSVASEDLLNTFSAGIAGSASGIASCLTVTVPDENEPPTTSRSARGAIP